MNSLFSRIIIITSMLLGSVALCLLISGFSIFNLNSFQQKNTLIGSVSKIKQDIRHKSNQMLGWKNIQKQISIYEGDSIFSGEDSQVFVQLNNKSTITLHANSLISFPISEDVKFTQLQIEYGNLDLAIDPGHPAKIQSEGRKIIIDSVNTSAKIKLKVDTDIKINVENGEAKVSSAGVEKNIAAGTQGLKIDSATQFTDLPIEQEDSDALGMEVSPLPSPEPTLLVVMVAPSPTPTSTPAPEGIFITPTPTPELMFVTPTATPSPEPTPLSSAKKEKLKLLKLNSMSKKPKPAITPVAASSPRPSVIPQAIVAPKVPILIEPLDGATLYYPKTEALLVVFSWFKATGADLYWLQISEQKNFKNLLYEEKIKSPSFKYTFKNTADIFWRVKSMSNNRESAWSEIRTASVTH